MDSGKDLEFHMPAEDENGRALEKAKESILLIKKKMFRSHDLILQYNNKLKECERLKEDLSLVQEEANKLKRVNNLNLSKVVKLEMQSADYKKIRQELEQQIAEKDIQLASNKSHLQQLECKLNAVEEKHVEKEMEAELNRSSLEVKTKELEQELKALKKSHLSEVNKLERALKSTKEKKGKKINEVAKETRDTGVNTAKVVEQPQSVKPTTVNKMVLTNEFYHIQDNPYPLFCHRCESLIEPKVEKICEIMAHPPLVGNMLSPVRPRVPERQRRNHNDANSLDSHCLKIIPNDLNRNESTHTEINLNDTSRAKLNYNETSRVDESPRNFVSPLPLQVPASTNSHEFQPTSMDIKVPELDSLYRKIVTLERKIKKQKIQKSSDSQQPSANCCSHPMNYYGHSSTHANPVPNVFPNIQVDLMTEFFNRMMNIANERDLHPKTTKATSRKKERTLRDKRLRNKLRKLKKIKILKKSSSTNWEIESDECDAANDAEKCFDPSDPTKPHLLRIKPSSVDDSSVTLCSDAESEKLSPMKTSLKTSFPEASEKIGKTPEKANCIQCDSNQESAIKVPDKRLVSTRGRKRGRASLFDDDGESERELESVKNEIIEESQTNRTEKSTRNTRTRSKSLRDDTNERKSLSVEKAALEQQNLVNSALHSVSQESISLLSDGDPRDPETCISSRSSEINELPLDFKGVDYGGQTFRKSGVFTSDADQNDVSPDVHSDSEPLECTSLKDRVEMRKRKRSISPKATQHTGRSNLLGKLRALKKNSFMNVTKTSNAPTIHTTRSLSRRKLTGQSENDDFEGTTNEDKTASSVSGDETSPCVPMKKQRIAHVPKKATSPQIDGEELTANSKSSKLIESPNKLYKDTDERTMEVHQAAIMKRPVTRRSVMEKSVQNKLKNVQESGKSGKVGRPRLAGGVTAICRRGRPPGKRNVALNAQLSLDSGSKELAPVDSKAESTKNQVNAEDDIDTSVLRNTRDINAKDLTKNSERSIQKIQVHANGVQESLEKEQISGLVTSVIAKSAKDSFVQSDRKEESLTQSIAAAGAPINKMGAAHALQVEKLSDLLDASSSSPAASLASLDGALVMPAEISILPSQSTVSVSATAIEIKELNERSSCERSSILINEMDGTAPACMHYTTDKANLATSPETRNEIAQNKDTSDESKNSLTGQVVNEIISKIPDVSLVSLSESPASPNSAQNSPTKNIEFVTSQPVKPEDRLSIYDNVALSIPLEVTENWISMNYYNAPVENATITNKFTSQDTLNDMPIEKPIERRVLVYDTNLHNNLEDECEEFDLKNIVKPQFFIETSVAAKKAARKSGSSIEPINVVKELRSRQVLCCPSTPANHQNLQRMQSTVNDESKASFPKDTRASDCFTEVRSLGTLLNHHLVEQKKKHAVKNAKLRRAGAIKLQEAAEENVKVELNKLVKSEEWTSELHLSVVARLADVRSERTVAKSIVDFLLERALLDEPLDRTYTPPAPVMTRTQQRIVTLMSCLERVDTMACIFDMVQSGIEYNVFKLDGVVLSVETIEYLFRVFTVIARLRKDRERVRILCCDAFYFLGRRAMPAIHVILTVWPEILPKHGTVESELPNCLAHMIKQEYLGKDPFPKVLALKKLITNYYEYPQIQALSAVVMTVLLKALQEMYSSDLEVAILLISKREGTQWAINNVIEKGLMKIIQDDSYRWQFEILNLLGFIVRSFPTLDTDNSVKKFVDLLCQMLDSGEGSHDKQEGIVAALLSLSRYKAQFGRISDSLLKWTPDQELRATTLEQLDLFFKSHAPIWWNNRLQYKMKESADAIDKNN